MNQLCLNPDNNIEENRKHNQNIIRNYEKYQIFLICLLINTID